MNMDYDASGWATKYNVKCSDGRTIRNNAFAHMDGCEVPVVYGHNHTDIRQLVGHAYLEHRDNEGVYAYLSFNSNPMGECAKEDVRHRDVRYLSIYANELKQHKGDVMHGQIKELSLVLAGANREAIIDNVLLHGEECMDEAFIFMGDEIVNSNGTIITHSDKKENQMTEKTPSGEKTGADIMETFDEEQKTLYDYSVKKAYEAGYEAGKGASEDNIEENQNEGDNSMKHHMFANDDAYIATENDNVITHSDINAIYAAAIANSRQYGGIRNALDALMHENDLGKDTGDFLAHAQDYGIRNLEEVLLPEYHRMDKTPQKVQRNKEWVDKILKGVSPYPFERIRSDYMDLTGEEIRAKGYVKGDYKLESVFGLLKRETEGQTFYVKQRMDKDDMDRVKDYDTAKMVSDHMDGSLDEEQASAILLGDGRAVTDPQHIKTDRIRPIVSDDDFFTIKAVLGTQGMSSDEEAVAFIDSVVLIQQDYEGSGTPDMYCERGAVTKALLLKDTIGHRLYKNRQELADAMNVKSIVEIPSPIWRRGGTNLKCILVDIADYRVGANPGTAESNMMTQFDIDYNQQKWLKERRGSGALHIPFSAVALRTDNTKTGLTSTTFEGTMAAIHAAGKVDLTTSEQ